MEWVVCKDKWGEYYLHTREDRENILGLCLIMGIQPESYVIKRFWDMEDAMVYIKEMRDVDNTLNEIFK